MRIAEVVHIADGSQSINDSYDSPLHEKYKKVKIEKKERLPQVRANNDSHPSMFETEQMSGTSCISPAMSKKRYGPLKKMNESLNQTPNNTYSLGL